MQDAVKNRELVSALADGQLREDELDRMEQVIEHDDDARLSWHAYHVVGEVLRSGEATACSRDVAFLARLKLQLQPETPTLRHAVSTLSAVEIIRPCSTDTTNVKHGAANDARYRWTLLAGFASLLVLSVVGLLASHVWDAQHGTPQLAQSVVKSAKPTLASSMLFQDEPPVMVRNRELDALLAAHKQFGGTSALQVPTGFIRNATFEGADR